MHGPLAAVVATAFPSTAAAILAEQREPLVTMRTIAFYTENWRQDPRQSRGEAA